LTTPFFDEAIRPQVVDSVRAVLLKIKAQPAQGYKRLMDEVGLSTRNGSAGPSRDHATSSHSVERQRPGSQHSQVNGHMPPPQFNGQFYPMQQQQQFDVNMGMQRTDSVDSNLAFPAYGTPMLNPSNVFVPPVTLQQYQQSYLSRVAPPINNFYPNMQSGFGYNNVSPSPEHYRNQGLQNASPIQQPSPGPMLNQSPFGPPGFANMGMGMGAYGYAGMGMQGMGYGMQQEQQVNGRRGRR